MHTVCLTLQNQSWGKRRHCYCLKVLFDGEKLINKHVSCFTKSPFSCLRVYSHLIIHKIVKLVSKVNCMNRLLQQNVKYNKYHCTLIALSHILEENSNKNWIFSYGAIWCSQSVSTDTYPSCSRSFVCMYQQLSASSQTQLETTHVPFQ